MHSPHFYFSFTNTVPTFLSFFSFLATAFNTSFFMLLYHLPCGNPGLVASLFSRILFSWFPSLFSLVYLLSHAPMG